MAAPNTKETPLQSRTITRTSTLHSLFNRTLRACQAFQRLLPPSDDPDEPHASTFSPIAKDATGKDGRTPHIEALFIASLGTGLDGHPGLAHGGTVGTLFDEGLSLAALQVLPRAFMTANTLIRYQNPVPTPSVLLVRSGVVKWDGRKAWVNGSMEDGEGRVYAEAECLYIMVRESKA